ncbi:CoA-transferase subunit beta [Oceanibium sediminis]|uniref:CoA-transferase subunit beta n=1 Tax=Oceanibium sediminis TaxID=2026339 RepID=UPI000DD4B225|nr:ketoacid CoA transferase [Oceanibium sediminis]
MSTDTFTLAELMISAAARAFANDGEVMANGIGTLPRIAAGLAKLTLNEKLMLSDGEAYALETPLPLNVALEDRPGASGWMPYHRVFESLWSGRRHAMVTPVQIDRFAQSNISCLGDFNAPKVQLLGVRGFPGNSISHRNSMLVTSHDRRTFVPGEVDVVSSAGYSDRLVPEGAKRPEVDIALVVTPLCVMDFKGPDNAAQVLSLHPGVSFEEVADATGFELLRAPGMAVTAVPIDEELQIIRQLDPDNLRARAIKGDPPGVRQEAA